MNPNPSQATTLALAALACLHLTATVSRADEPAASAIPPEHLEFFEKEVRPLLVKRCFECHDGSVTKGGLSLALAHGWQTGGDSGPAIVPGKPDESLLIQSIRYTDEDYQMPPSKIGKLPDEEITILTKWVAMGAPDPRTGTETLGGMTLDEAETWWSFQPLPDPPPAGLAANAARIDQLLRREIERHGLETAPPADPRTLIRRLSYDLTGLPPGADEVETFVTDSSPAAFSQQVERLLDSPQYGVQWGRRWLDVVRYADSAGDNSDRPLPHAWRYRNWVMEAFQRDLPYDEFVRLQLAGDLLADQTDPNERSEGIIATGYLALFDGADPNASTAARETSTVPTQALYFLNDPVFHAQAPAVAEKLVSLPGDGTRLAEAWLLLLQRKPTEDETTRTRDFLAAYPGDPSEKWAAQVRVLMASNEFVHVD